MVTAFRPRLPPLPCDVLFASISVFTLSKSYGLNTVRGSVMKPCVCGACNALPPLPKSCDTTACLTRPTDDMIQRRKTQGGTHDAIRSTGDRPRSQCGPAELSRFLGAQFLISQRQDAPAAER